MPWGKPSQINLTDAGIRQQAKVTAGQKRKLLTGKSLPVGKSSGRGGEMYGPGLEFAILVFGRAADGALVRGFADDRVAAYGTDKNRRRLDVFTCSH